MECNTVKVLKLKHRLVLTGHSNEKRSVVPVVCRPEFLRVRHQLSEIAFETIKIELFELGCVIETRTHRGSPLVVLI